MSLKDYKITQNDIETKGVVAAPDVMSGDPQANKRIFDRLIREAVAEKFNDLVDELISSGVEVILKRGDDSIQYIRLNDDNVLEVSADGKEYEATGSSGHLIIDADGNAMPQRGRLQFPDGSVEDIAGVTVVKSIGGIPVAKKGVPNGVAELDDTGKVPVVQLPEAVDLGGLGYKRVITNSDDMDNITEDGIYVYPTTVTPANAPFDGSAVVLVFGSPNTGTQRVQLAWRYSETGRLKFRTLVSGAWNPWSDVFTSTYNGWDLLWENASKTSAFPPQDLVVNTKGYDYLLVVASYNDGEIEGQDVSIVRLRQYNAGNTNACVAVKYITTNNVCYAPYRKMTVPYTRNKIAFSGAYGEGKAVADTYVIPYYIYGIKGVYNP